MITFAVWKGENPSGRVLLPDTRDQKWKEFADEFEKDAAAPSPSPPEEKNGQLARKELIAGLTANGVAKAYPLSALEQQSPIIDSVGGVQLVVVMEDDKKSVRAFEATIDGQHLEFYTKPDAKPVRLVDQETGSEWNFSGRCISGPMTGRQLKRMNVLTEYWFDWKYHHPSTAIYNLQPG